MAVSVGSHILASDIRTWYSNFNRVISNYSNGLSGVGAGPNSGDYAYASHINTLNTRLTQFRSDKFLGTQAGWWTPSSVSVGDYIRVSGVQNIINSMNNFSRVKCRNTATNSKGQRSYDTNGNGAYGNGVWGNGVWGNVAHVNSYWGNGVWGNGAWSYTNWGNGTWSNGAWGFGAHSNGTHWNSTYNNSGRSCGYNGFWAKSNGNKSNGAYGNGTYSNGTNTNGSYSNGTYSNGYYSNGTNNNGTYSNGTYSNGVWGNVAHGNGNWGNTTTIDITCSQGTKTN